GDDGSSDDGDEDTERPSVRTPEHIEALDVQLPEPSLQDPAEALRDARGQANEATAEASQGGEPSGAPLDPSAGAGQRPGAVREARGQANEATAEASQAGETSGAPLDPSAAAGQRPADDPEVPPAAKPWDQQE